MKAEDLYDAVTELRDEQIAEGEKRLPKKHPAYFRRLGALAAVLAVVLLAGALTWPKLTGGRNLGGEPVAAETGAQSPTGAEPTGDVAPTEEPTEQGCFSLPTKYSLARAAYPKMAPYPDEKAFWKGGSFDDDAFDAALRAWTESRSALRSDVDYAQGLTSYLQTAVPVLLEGSGEENRVISPLNIYMALSMLAETTAGESRAELLKLLNAPDLATLRDRAEALWRANYCDDGRLTELLAASLWLRDETDYNAETLQTLAERYYSSVFSGEMGSEEYNAALREWMNEQTKALLADQIEKLGMDGDTVMALVTTIYFKAAWQDAFRKTETRSFRAPAGEQSCGFLLESSVTDYYSGDGFTAAGKSLQEGGSMYFLLPEEGLSPEALLEREGVLDFLTDAAGRGQTEHKTAIVHLAVPKFDVSAQLELREKLEALGVQAIFDPGKADFTPLCQGSMAVSEAQHGARLMIDEEGVTGAAYTILLTEGAPETGELEELELTLDRPFLFAVTNAEGLPLFVGIVNTP